MSSIASSGIVSTLLSPTFLTYYLAPLAVVFFVYFRGHKRRDQENLTQYQANKEAGLTEPPSLHPVIDASKCLGSNACVIACPEGDIIGVIAGKAQVINPTNCVGHGACKTACPYDAITLVFGTEKRGIDIPHVTPTFETNVPGIYIAGELGGMGLIRNAITQGRQAIDAIKKRDSKAEYDVVIVGAGPAGLSASLAALDSKLDFVTVEQEDLGGTVAHFPRGKIVMTSPVTLPIIGKVKMRETTKEALLSFWQEITQKTNLKINYKERLEEITPSDKGFLVKTTHKTYEADAVLLTIGRRGTPRKLDVPGEEMSKVVYKLVDPQQYRGQHVLVVGGGDSALEAAASIAEDEPSSTVTLSYRSDAFARTKPKNRGRIDALKAAKRLQVLLSSNVKKITAETVTIEQGGKIMEIPNNAVIVCAGGVLPTPFLKKLGIEIETKYGTA